MLVTDERKQNLTPAFTPGRQLTAGGKDIAPAGLAYECVNALGLEDGFEDLNPFRRGWMVGKRIRRIVRNQIHLRAQVVAIQQIRKLARLLIRIVDAVEHHVLESESLARLQRFLELLTSGKQLFEWPLL